MNADKFCKAVNNANAHWSKGATTATVGHILQALNLLKEEMAVRPAPAQPPPPPEKPQS